MASLDGVRAALKKALGTLPGGFEVRSSFFEGPTRRPVARLIYDGINYEKVVGREEKVPDEDADHAWLASTVLEGLTDEYIAQDFCEKVQDCQEQLEALKAAKT